MMIGFGATEERFEKEQETAARDFIIEAFSEGNYDYIEDDFIDVIRRWLNERSNEADKAYNYNRKLDNPPERYSSFWASVANSANDVVVIFHFFHVNRRHALSPDGMACMRTTRLLHLEYLDMKDEAKTRAHYEALAEEAEADND